MSEAGRREPVPNVAPNSMSAKTATLRVAVLDDDSGFVHVLIKRLEGAGCQYRVLSGPVPAEELAAMKLNALVVDPRCSARSPGTSSSGSAGCSPTSA